MSELNETATLPVVTGEGGGIARIAAALARAQLKIVGALKTAENAHLKSHYATLADVWDACHAALNGEGIAIVQIPSHIIKAINGQEMQMVEVTTRLIHESGEYLTGAISSPIQQTTPQGIGSAITYLRRYGLSAIAGVASIEDDDGEGAERGAPTDAKPSAKRIGEIKKLVADCATMPALVELRNTLTPGEIESCNKLFTARKAELTSSTKPNAPASGTPPALAS